MLVSETHNVADQHSTPRWLLVMARETYELARSMRCRWRLYRMQWLDDHMLDDIGVTREELEWAIRLPLRINAALPLNDRARRRRAAESKGQRRDR